MQVTLRQYYHLHQGDVNSILRHWVWRQAASMVPFCFKKVTKATPQGSGNGVDTESSDKDEGLQSVDSGSDHSGEEDNLCYNPPTNFSFLPSSGPPSTQPAVPLPQPISTAPTPAPPAQPTLSSQAAPLAFNPFHTSYLPLYDVTDFYEHPQGYAQLQQPLGSPHRQPLLPSPDPDAEMSSPTHASDSINHYGLLQPPSC